MSWEDLRIFAVVARHRSFTRAAERLGTGQPALSRRIARLEVRLRVRLFHRGSRELVLTDAGRILVQRVDQMSRAWSRAVLDLAELSGTRTAPVQLSTEWIADVPGVIGRLERHWGRPVAHSRGSAYQQIPRLLAGELDIVQGFTVPTTPVDFGPVAIATLAREPIWAYLPPTHPRVDHYLSRGGLDLSDLADQDWLATRLDQPLYEYLVDICHQAGFTPRIARITDSLTMFTDAFATGRYVTMGTPIAPRRFGPAVAVPLTGPPDRHGFLPARHAFLAWRPHTLPDDDTAGLIATFRAWYRHLAHTRQPAYARHLDATLSGPVPPET